MGSGPGSAQFETQLAPSEPANTQDDELDTRLYCLQFPYLIYFILTGLWPPLRDFGCSLDQPLQFPDPLVSPSTQMILPLSRITLIHLNPGLHTHSPSLSCQLSKRHNTKAEIIANFPIPLAPPSTAIETQFIAAAYTRKTLCYMTFS